MMIMVIFYTALLVAASSLLLISVTSSKWWRPWKSYRNRSMAEVNPPPGSRGLPLIGETVQFMAAIYSGRGFYDFVHTRRLRYGKCFRTHIFGATNVFVSTTAAAKTILSDRFTKKYIRSIAELMGDHSILCAKSDQHHRLIRACLGTLFSTGSLSLFVGQFDDMVVKSISGWEHRDTVVILDEATEAICKMLMSLEDGDELDTLQKDIALVCKAMLAFPLKLPGTQFWSGIEARRRIMTTLETIINNRRRLHRRSTPIPREDFLEHLLNMEEAIESQTLTLTLTKEEIKDNILTMIIAGQDTTASAITWMVKYLGENREVLDLLLQEQICIAKRISPESILKLEDVIGEMPYASKVIKESLRMASVVPWFPRLVLHDSEIEGFGMKRGWTVNVDAKSIHFDKTLHDNPHEFNPSRFDNEAKPYSFLAFGTGGRTCLGMNMAKAMMLVFLHRLVTTYRWEVVDSDSNLEKWSMFSRLNNGCPVCVTRLE